ncbi:uncharacterized protein LOC144342472 [Saccoglossus kowalevskii]
MECFLRKPKRQPEKCDRWISACSRGDDFGRHRIKQDTYVCSLHFVGGNGPTEEHPDPIPATAREVELRMFVTRKKRPPPKDRTVTVTGNKPKRPKVQQLVTDKNTPIVPPQSPSCLNPLLTTDNMNNVQKTPCNYITQQRE